MAYAPPTEDAEGRQLPPLPCLEASDLVLRATDRAYHDIRRLANILSRVNLDSRREDLLDYIRLNRSRFVKAYATISWLAGSQGDLVVNASNARAEAQSQREQIDTVSSISPLLTCSCCISQTLDGSQQQQQQQRSGRYGQVLWQAVIIGVRFYRGEIFSSLQ